MGMFLLTTVIIGMAMLVMAVGVIFNFRCLSGSCGGAGVLGPDGERCPVQRVHAREPTRTGGQSTVDPQG